MARILLPALFLIFSACSAPKQTGLVQISENLYYLQDCCNVYLIKDGAAGVLIDYGSGRIMDHLAEAGVSRISALFLTHHHRDQLQGLTDGKKGDFQIYAPKGELKYISRAETFWDQVRLYSWYNLRSYFNTTRKNIPDVIGLEDGQTVTMGNLNLTALVTPGHTDSALTYAATIDDKKRLFSNDLISAPGKVATYYDLHWSYMGYSTGMEASLKSFDRLLAERPDQLLPSHGSPIDNPDEALGLLAEKYRRLIPMVIPNRQNGNRDFDLITVSPHIVYLGGTSYALVSDSKKALIYDYGYISLKQIRAFIKKYDIQSIPVVAYSHYHNDHIARTHELIHIVDSYGIRTETEVWIFENMVDIFENPTRYHMPCLVPYSIKADRVIRDGEVIEWEGLRLNFFHMPGQTIYHMGMWLDDNGKRYVFAGDNNWHPKVLPMNSPVIPHNRYFVEDNHGYLKISKDLLEIKPDVMLPAHYLPYDVDENALKLYRGWAERLSAIFRDLIDQPEVNMGMDQPWIRFYPYHITLEGKKEFTSSVVILNHLDSRARFDITLKTGDDAAAAPVKTSIEIEANQTAEVPFTFTLNRPSERKRLVFCADITVNNRYLGEYAELVVNP